MTRERIEELKRLHEAARAHEGGHGVSDAPLHEFRRAMLAALPRLLLERERAAEAIRAIEPIAQAAMRTESGDTANLRAYEKLLEALAFVEEEA